MAWVAFDRAVKGVETHGLKGPVEQWRALRDRIAAEACDKGFDAKRNTFRAAYDSDQLDASLLLLAQTGFVKPDDPRYIGTVEAIERELMVDGFVLRYSTLVTDDGLSPGEGAFLACSFWLANALDLTGRTKEATQLFERLLSLRNDVGLLSEEYDPRYGRQVGNTPQAFSHMPLIQTALNLAEHATEHRRSADASAARDERRTVSG
jgi:GH15 family glucan-1,4-alpha-glucosidase